MCLCLAYNVIDDTCIKYGEGLSCDTKCPKLFFYSYSCNSICSLVEFSLLLGAMQFCYIVHGLTDVLKQIIL